MFGGMACEGLHFLRTSRGWIGALVIAGSAWVPLQAPAQEARRDAPRSEAQWIQAARTAALRINYTGTIIYQAGGEMTSSRITHMFDGSKSHERIQTLDGKPREYLRKRSDSDDEVQCLIPESKKIVVEKRSVEESFPTLSSASPDEILQRYEAKLGPVERVAGLDAQALALEPRDNLRYAYRLWLDRATRSAAARADAERAQGSDRADRVQRCAHRRTHRSRGAEVPLGHRRLVRGAQRLPEGRSREAGLDRPDAGRLPQDQGGRAAHACAPTPCRWCSPTAWRRSPCSSSPIRRSADPPATVRAYGPTSAFSRRVSDALVTVVGEVPPGTVRAVAQSVEFRGTR